MPSRAPRTSLAAYHSLTLAPILLQVLGAVESAGSVGMTCDEIAEDTGIEYRTVTPRIIQLERQGLVYRAGDTRKGRTGRSQLIVRSCIYLATIPVIVKPTKAKSEDGDQFLKGMIRATRIVAEQESVDAAISVLKREMIDRAKVASR